MSAFNVVRCKVKPGREEAFLQEHRAMKPFPGMRRFSILQTGERAFCIVGEWDGMQSLVAARPAMIQQLDRFRGMLEDLGGGLGVTDAASGDVVVDVKG